MKKSLISKILVLGMLMIPGVNAVAQTAEADDNQAFLKVMVTAKPEGATGAMALVPMEGVEIRIYLPDGKCYKAISLEELTEFRKATAGCEYVAEIFCRGYETAIYHGFVSDRPFARAEFYTVKSSVKKTKKLPTFKDHGTADIEGFAVCPASSWEWVSAPLAGATVTYTSSTESVKTKTDIHGYFSFDGIKDKSGKISITHDSCADAEFSAVPENGFRWLWLQVKPAR
ncbi:MAG: hypothetical protein KBT44_06510 [Bacteroidales bacterium]|nr:hypothetical protein [Candidatus Equibacterium intestinale]